MLSETCKPVSYCSRNQTSNACQCDEDKLGVLGLLDPASKKVCQTTCKDWAVKDLDCPKGGCLGFSFKMGENFKAQDQYQRPKPERVPDDHAWQSMEDDLVPRHQTSRRLHLY